MSLGEPEMVGADALGGVSALFLFGYQSDRNRAFTLNMRVYLQFA